MFRKLKSINKELGLVKVVDVCENGCCLFPEGSTNPSECPHCRSPRFANQDISQASKANAVMSIVSVGAAIAERLFEEDARESFMYRERFERDIHEDGVYHDFFSGKAFREQYARQGLFQDSRDIALLMVVDGFQPRSKKTYYYDCCFLLYNEHGPC
ncbi:hypothetical protein G6F56_012763 [Rhizopus delemar]|nr:hypothetical protein G6F56_012763 [Rhizopus delemar]